MRKFRVSLSVCLISLLLLLKRAVELLLIILKKTVEGIGSSLPKLFFSLYTGWRRIKKAKQKLSRNFSHIENKPFYILTRNQLIYALIILLVLLALTESSIAMNMGGENFGQGTPLIVMEEKVSGEEIVIEQGFPLLQQENGLASAGMEVQTEPLAKNENEKENPVLTDSLATMNGTALIKPNIIDQERPKTRTEIEEYIVQPGDNISKIAEKFSVSTDTILWANKLSYSSLIRIGQKLIIPPISGIIHQVKRGDTVSSLAKLYKADIKDIIDFNKLADGSDISIGETLVIPEGKIVYQAQPVVKRKQTITVPKSEEMNDYLSWTKTTNCHTFALGYCTSWVAYKWDTLRGQCVPKWGHARTWLQNATKSGFLVCAGQDCQPTVGAIIVVRIPNYWYGHVAYVENVSGNSVTFSEMNYGGRWNINWRTLNINDGRIIGYIY